MGAFTEKWQTQPSWVFTKQGIAVDKYPQFFDESKSPASRNKGNYYPQVLDMSHLADFPGDAMIMCTSDHDYEGLDGFYMSYRRTGETTWTTYDEGLALGDFDYLATKPTGNPIFVDRVTGQQTETFHSHWIDNQFVAGYQQENTGSHQSTVRATSPDGVNWTRNGMLLDYNKDANIGDGHTGYLRWGLAKDLQFPFKYIGTALHGGGNGYMQVCGCNDPTNEEFETTAILKYHRGSWIEDIGKTNDWSLKDVPMSPDMTRQIGRYFYNYLSVGQPQQGLIATINQAYLVPMSDDMTYMKGVGTPAMAMGESGVDPDDKWQVCFSMLGNEMYYQALTETPEATEVTMWATIDKDGPLIEKQRLSLEPPHDVQRYAHDFKANHALPTHLDLTTTAGTYIHDTYYTTFSIPDGDSVVVSGGKGFVPANTDFAEIFLNNVRFFDGYNNDCKIWLGFADSKGDIVSVSNFVGLTSSDTIVTDSTTESDVMMTIKNADSTVLDDPAIALTAFQSSTIRKQQGVRWYPQASRVYELDHSKTEFWRFDQAGVDAINMDATYYPVVGVTNNVGDGSVATFALDQFSFELKEQAQSRPLPDGEWQETRNIPVFYGSDDQSYFSLDQSISFVDGVNLAYDISFKYRKMSGLSVIGVCSSSSGSSSLFISEAGNFALKVSSNYKTFFATPEDADVHEIRILRRDDATMSVYIDGVESATHTSTSSLVINNIAIGHNSTVSTEGSVFDMKIYDGDRDNGGVLLHDFSMSSDGYKDSFTDQVGGIVATHVNMRRDTFIEMQRYKRGDNSEYWVSTDRSVQYELA